jgi:hypothetical protein
MIDLKLSDLFAPPTDEDIIEALNATPVATPADIPGLKRDADKTKAAAPAQRDRSPPGTSERRD